MTEKRTIRIDASSMGDLHCFLKFYRRVVEQYTSPKEDGPMVFGSAMHIFLEELAKTKNEGLSIGRSVRYFNEHLTKGLEFPENKQHLNVAYLTALCAKYLEEFNVDDSQRDFKFIRNEKGEPLVEYTFSIKVYEDDFIIVFLQGTIDMIGRFNNGSVIAFGDYKSTHSWKQEDYLRQHKMKNQLRTYSWAIKHLASEAEKENPYKSLFSGRLGGFIFGAFLKPDTSKIVFKRSEIFFYTQEDMDEYWEQLSDLCRRLSSYIQHGVIPAREGIMNNTCSGNYGDCPFLAVCGAPSKDIGQRLLQQFFVKKDYEPLKFRK